MRDLRDTIHELNDDLLRIKDKFSTDLEISAFTNLVQKKRGPALLFENPEGYKNPVLINIFGTEKRMNRILGKDLETIKNEISEILELTSKKPGLLDGIRLYSKLKSFGTEAVNSGPVNETKLNGLSEIPILKTWPKDAGKYITAPVVITKDPETGIYNAGTYRMQVFDDETTGMHWQRQKTGYNHMLKAKNMGKNLDVAVVIGVHPAIFFSSISPLPEGINEMAFAGYLMGEKTRLVKGQTVDLYYPADAEIVLEGYVDPMETKIEGPFGDHTGYYSPPEEYPVFHIKRISAREDFIYHATVVGKFWNEDVVIGHAIEKIFLPAIKLLIPDIVDIFLPEEGVLNDIAIVSIDKKYPGQGIKAGMAVLSQGQLMFSKYVIVVDKDINVRDKSEVLWAIATRTDPSRDVVIIPRAPADSLDHASFLPNLSGKMIIDATVKTREEGVVREWPEKIEMNEYEILKGKIEKYGF
ncbi:MAG: menaquinone biosynthesis decarboxylase [Thermoplasmatales archaeon]